MQELKKNATIEVSWKTSVYDYSKSKELDIRDKAAKKYGVDKKNVHVTVDLVSQNGASEVVSLRDDVIGDIQNPLFQQSMFKDCLEVNGVKDYDLEALFTIDRTINDRIDYDSFTRSKTYFIKWLKWDNFLSYGDGNSFDFTKYHGLVLLNGEPANQSGKTTFAMELIRFIFFGETTKYKTQAEVFNRYRPEATNVNAEMCITIDCQDYIIKRVLTRPALAKRTEKSKVTSSVTYYKVVGETNIELTDYNKDEVYNGESVGATNKVIKEAIGNADDFDLSLCATSKNLDGIIDKKSTDRGRLFARWIGLLPLEKKDEIAREVFNKSIRDSLLVGKYNVEGLLNENKTNEASVAEYESKKVTHECLIKEAQDTIDQNTAKVKELATQKAKVDASLLSIDVDTINRAIETVINNGKLKKAELDEVKKQIEEFGEVDYSIDKSLELGSEQSKMNTAIVVLNGDIKRNEDTIKALKTSEYCPTCGRKYDNVDNSGKIAELEQESQKKRSELAETTAKLQAKMEEIKAYAELGKRAEKKNAAIALASSMEVTLANMRNELLELRAKLKAYEQNREAIANNAKLDLGIANCEATINASKQQLTVNTSAKVECESTIATLQAGIKRNTELVERIHKDEVQLRNWKMYLDIVGKNGISKMVVRKALPIINVNLSRLLSGVCDFDVNVLINDKNEIDFEIVRDGQRYNLSGGSGFEMTAAALALRTVLANMSTMGRPQFVVLDEILGRVSPKNYDNMRSLYNKVLESYSLIMQVTFIQDIADWHNAIVTVNKVNNISKLQEEI